MYKNLPAPRDSSRLRAVVWNSSKSHFGRGKKWDWEVGSDGRSHSLPPACGNKECRLKDKVFTGLKFLHGNLAKTI